MPPRGTDGPSVAGAGIGYSTIALHHHAASCLRPADLPFLQPTPSTGSARQMMTVAAHASLRSEVKLPHARYSIALRSAKIPRTSFAAVHEFAPQRRARAGRSPHSKGTAQTIPSCGSHYFEPPPPRGHDRCLDRRFFLSSVNRSSWYPCPEVSRPYGLSRRSAQSPEPPARGSPTCFVPRCPRRRAEQRGLNPARR
jgi:hypothetical protein